MFTRISEIGTGQGNTSGYLRTIRGFIVFSKLDFVHKITGVGLGNIADAFEKFNISILGDDEFSLEYMNSFAYILNSTGMIGAGLLLSVLIKGMLSHDYIVKSIGVIVLVMILGASVYNSSSWLIYMTFLLYGSNRNMGMYRRYPVINKINYEG